MSNSKYDSTAQSIRVEMGECVVLSPESQRFKENYRQVHPRTADEVREIIGLSTETAKALREQGVCCQPSENFSAIIPAEELDSPDGAVRERAWNIAQTALTRYIYSANPQSLSQMEPLIARYLDITKAVLNIAVLPDVEVGSGATLTVSTDTHLVRANKIVIHDTGEILCSGFTKFTATSLEGGA